MAALHPEIRKFHSVRISFTRQSGTFLKVKDSDSFRFPTGELVAPAERSPSR